MRPSFRAGERVAVAVSGGADSVALLLAMAQSRAETGLVLSVVHVHHGLRGAEADADERFVAQLAARLELPLRSERGDVAALAEGRGQGVEEAARALRYGVFRGLLGACGVDAVATAHTLDDQAETVLMKLLRGAWTEGLGGISPVVQVAGGGRIVRPLLAVSRTEVVAFLKAAGQPWCEDSTNVDPAFTRNRVRHTLLPVLREFQPRIAEQLARMATVARDEDAWWQREMVRVLPGLMLPGKPVRGGGRANSTQPGEAARAIELERLRALHPAQRRRVLRAAAGQMGSALSFAQTEALLALAAEEAPGGGKRRRVELSAGLVAERTARELRLELRTERRTQRPAHPPKPELPVAVPGTLEALDYGYSLTVAGRLPGTDPLLLRTPRPGDRVRPLHGRGSKTVKEVLERRAVAASERADWPVLALGSTIVWMHGVEVESTPGLELTVSPLVIS